MRTLGAIFAGGRSSRFGSDKAVAEIDGTTLIDRALSALRAQCDAVVVVGRTWPGSHSVDDLPRAGLGPLGALAGALAHARATGYAQLLTASCDLPDLPPDLRRCLEPGPAVIDGQPLLGLWPSSLAESLTAHLGSSDDRSMRGWVKITGARRVATPEPVVNINTREELERYLAARSSASQRSSPP